MILACADKISFGVVKGTETNRLPKGDTKEEWNPLKVQFEPNTGPGLLTLKKFKNYKQGFKVTCRPCRKYGNEATNWWENEKNKNKMVITLIISSKVNVITVVSTTIKRGIAEKRKQLKIKKTTVLTLQKKKKMMMIWF